MMPRAASRHRSESGKAKVRPKRLLADAWKDQPDRGLVEVLWFDAGDISGEPWFDPSDVTNRLYRTVTVGYIVCEDEKAVSLVATCNEHHYAHGIVIPTAWIEQIRHLT
jgi:hypothetical protein